MTNSGNPWLMLITETDIRYAQMEKEALAIA